MRNRIGGEKQPQRPHLRALNPLTTRTPTKTTHRSLPEHHPHEIHANRALPRHAALLLVAIGPRIQVQIQPGAHLRRRSPSTSLEVRRHLLGPRHHHDQIVRAADREIRRRVYLRERGQHRKWSHGFQAKSRLSNEDNASIRG